MKALFMDKCVTHSKTQGLRINLGPSIFHSEWYALPYVYVYWFHPIPWIHVVCIIIFAVQSQSEECHPSLKIPVVTPETELELLRQQYLISTTLCPISMSSIPNSSDRMVFEFQGILTYDLRECRPILWSQYMTVFQPFCC